MKIASKIFHWTILEINHVMTNLKTVNQPTEKKIIPLNMIHAHLQKIKSSMQIRLPKRSTIKKVQEIDIWLKKEVKYNRLITKMKTKKNIIQVSRETKIMVLAINLSHSLIAGNKIKKTKLLSKKVILKNHSHASKKQKILNRSQIWTKTMNRW